MILTVDIGNSRIKCAWWHADKIIAHGVVAYSGKNLQHCFEELFSAVSSSPAQTPARVLAVCVAENAIAQDLNGWVKQRWGLDIEYLKTEKQYKNITNAYDDPQQHGVDRWAGIVAGHLMFPGSSVCVISAGTAITFDFLNSDGRHLGGYILPSYATMHASLLADTANVESISSAQLLTTGIPDNTDDAVNQGLHKMLQAAVRDFCQLAKNRLEPPLQIILTGGFAKTMLEYPDMPAMRHEPDLVMQGLYDIMKSRKP